MIVIESLLSGTDTENPLIAPLTALGPIASTTEAVLFPKLSDAIGFGWEGFGCKKGIMSILRFPIGMKKFNEKSMQEVYKHLAATRPEFAGSFIMWEAYATQGVKAVGDVETAIADRGDNMLV